MADQVDEVKETKDSDESGNQVVTREVTHQSRDQKVSKAAQVVWFVIGIVVAILLLRVVLAMIGANLENAFANFVYAITDPFVAPFRGLLQIGEFQAGVARLELETLVAALVYTLFGWGVASAVRLAKKN